MNRTAFKIAASTVMVALTMTSVAAPSGAVRLAYALAGRAERAVDLLESAARSPMATPRTRQNLALAYAFAGDWNRARTIAAQDISPSDVDARMAQWAQMARPGAGPVQVAT